MSSFFVCPLTVCCRNIQTTLASKFHSTSTSHLLFNLGVQLHRSTRDANCSFLLCDWETEHGVRQVFLRPLGQTRNVDVMCGKQLTWIGVVDPTKSCGDVVVRQEDASVKRVQPNEHKVRLVSTQADINNNSNLLSLDAS